MFCTQDKWNELTKELPNFTKEIFIIADLVYYLDGFLIDSLNKVLASSNLGYHPSVASVMGRIQNKYTPIGEREDLSEALSQVFGWNQGRVNNLMTQWITAWQWFEKRHKLAHPMKTMKKADLEALKLEIKSNARITMTKDIAILMVDYMIMHCPSEEDRQNSQRQKNQRRKST